MTIVSMFLNLFMSNLYLVLEMCDGLGGGLRSLSALLVHFFEEMITRWPKADRAVQRAPLSPTLCSNRVPPNMQLPNLNGQERHSERKGRPSVLILHNV